MIEHRDEHGRHAVKDAGTLLGHGAQGEFGVKSVVGVDHGAAVGDAAEVGHDHAEAMVQRHRDHHTVAGCQAKAFTHHETVVEDVVVTERGTFGRTGGAGGVLDVHRLVELQALLTGCAGLNRRLPCPLGQCVPGQEAGRRVGGQADDTTQLGQAFTGQLTRPGAGKLRHQRLHHGVVIRRLEGFSADQPAAAGLAQHVFQLTHTVGRVDVDQDGADLGTGQLQDAPLGAVGRPDANTVAGVHAQCDQGAGVYFDLFSQLPPAVTQALVAGHQGLAVATAGHGGIEGLADGLGQQGSVLATAGIARLTHGCPFLWLFWARLKQAGILWRRFTFT
ncbi:hypothetical protein D3C79_660530 [compost metagenome]